MRQPVVLGELVAGIILGNLTYLGIEFFEGIRHDPGLATFAELGVILLMFEVGVESTVGDLMEVGFNALLVALLGVIAPFIVGFATVRLLFPDFSLWVGIFLGATLCATSVGISARVLKDMGKVQSLEGRTILGAAVVDDVLGLVILAVVVALIGSEGSSQPAGGPPIGRQVAAIVLKAFGFLIVGVSSGVLFSKGLYRWAARLQVRGMLLTLSLVMCFAFAYLAHAFDLAPIVGAFAAGPILEPEHSRIFVEQEEQSLEHLLLPLSTLVPLFFFHMGMRVDLGALISSQALLIGLALSVVAVAGKMACAGGVVSEPGKLDRWTVALGMIPRGG